MEKLKAKMFVEDDRQVFQPIRSEDLYSSGPMRNEDDYNSQQPMRAENNNGFSPKPMRTEDGSSSSSGSGEGFKKESSEEAVKVTSDKLKDEEEAKMDTEVSSTNAIEVNTVPGKYINR